MSLSEEPPTTLEVYDVFARTDRGGPLVEQFSLLAQSPKMALMLARENFFRRQTLYQLSVVQRSQLTTAVEGEAVASPHFRSYREVAYYRDLGARWRKYKHEPLTAETMV